MPPNIINSNTQYKQLLPILESLLPFEGKDVWLWKIGFDDKKNEEIPTITYIVEMEINGNTIVLERESNNEEYIENWFEKEIPSRYNMKTLGTVLQSVVGYNLKTLKEFVDEFC